VGLACPVLLAYHFLLVFQVVPSFQILLLAQPLLLHPWVPSIQSNQEVLVLLDHQLDQDYPENLFLQEDLDLLSCLAFQEYQAVQGNLAYLVDLAVLCLPSFQSHQVHQLDQVAQHHQDFQPLQVGPEVQLYLEVPFHPSYQ